MPFLALQSTESYCNNTVYWTTKRTDYKLVNTRPTNHEAHRSAMHMVIMMMKAAFNTNIAQEPEVSVPYIRFLRPEVNISSQHGYYTRHLFDVLCELVVRTGFELVRHNSVDLGQHV